MDIKQIKNIVKQVVRENKQSVLLETPPPSRQEHVKKYWQVLTEAGLSRVMGKYFEMGFMVISADRTCEAEKGMPCSDEEIRSQEQKNKKNEIEDQKIIFKEKIAVWNFVKDFYQKIPKKSIFQNFPKSKSF